MKLDWNRERYRTRDRLLEYDFSIYPAVPHTAGLSMVYPWENIALSQLSHSIIEIAKSNGYTGTEEEFWNKFSNGSIHYGTLETFPVPGVDYDLYLDTETDILYYFKTTKETIDLDQIEKIGVTIVGHSIIEDTQEVVTYLYIPVKALSLENISVEGG